MDAERLKSIKAARKGKKVWCPILAPQLFSNQMLGRSYVYVPEELVGKVVEANLMTLTGDMKNQNINVGFKVMGIKGDQGLTEVWSYTLIPAHIKKLIRRNRDKIDDCFILDTKNGIKTVVKPVILTNSKSSRAIRTDIRKLTRSIMAKYFKEFTFDEIVRDLIIHKLQSIIKKDVNRVTPVKACEIRIFERYIEPQKQAEEKTEEEVVIEEVKEEAKPVEEKKERKKRVSKKKAVEVPVETEVETSEEEDKATEEASDETSDAE
jgi:ribosomal protein S3AE